MLLERKTRRGNKKTRGNGISDEHYELIRAQQHGDEAHKIGPKGCILRPSSNHPPTQLSYWGEEEACLLVATLKR